jgi:hypothetical protein
MVGVKQSPPKLYAAATSPGWIFQDQDAKKFSKDPLVLSLPPCLQAGMSSSSCTIVAAWLAMASASSTKIDWCQEPAPLQADIRSAFAASLPPARLVRMHSMFRRAERAMGRKRNDRRTFCYLSLMCPFCETHGQLRFWRCPREQVVVVCDECCAFFRSPETLAMSDALADPKPPDWWSAELGFALAGPGSGWASRSEIEAAGWATYIAGEERTNRCT